MSAIFDPDYGPYLADPRDPRTPDDECAVNPEDAQTDAEDECMSDGYAIAWAIQSICLDTPLGCATDDERNGKDWLPTDRTSAQTLLAVLFSGCAENREIALLELRDRIAECPSMREDVRARAAELMGRAA